MTSYAMLAFEVALHKDHCLFSYRDPQAGAGKRI